MQKSGFLTIGAVAIFALSACMNESIYTNYYGEPEIVGRTKQTVQVRAGFNVNPAPAAEAACNGPVALEKSEATDLQGYYSIYYFQCT
ncbi:hypothetical protein [Litoreibacter roseus]|uniref:Uncharacterized protein n=1 Tax=Litoreibacter roseus TaxID=2601869 RepID=A0A6N6JI53_9RHOB|nr:hypothetical protein [Litoreibacter roseus]GFE66043.1 hypothetical protein KIN_31170 [Litoreibacter roseus]